MDGKEKKTMKKDKEKKCFVLFSLVDFTLLVLLHLKATSQTNSCCFATDNKGFSDFDIFIDTLSNCVGIFYSGQLGPLNVSHWGLKY